MSCLRWWITQFSCLTANLKYAGKQCWSLFRQRHYLNEFRNSHCIHFSPQWAEPCVHSVFWDTWFLFTWKKWLWKDTEAQWPERRGAARPCRSEGTEILVTPKDWWLFLEVSFWKEALENFACVLVKLLSVMCLWQDHLFWCNTASPSSCISMLFSMLFFFLTQDIYVHACNILYVPVFSSMSATHPRFHTPT